MKIKLLMEKELRLRIIKGNAEVYLRHNPETTIGRIAINYLSDVTHYDEALDIVNQMIGTLMPADLIAKSFLRKFHGIIYREGTISHFHCPKCAEGLYFDEIPIKSNSKGDFFKCPQCNQKHILEYCDYLPDKEVRDGKSRTAFISS